MMTRSIDDVKNDISIVNVQLDEWIKPLFSNIITNRLIQFDAKGTVKNSIADTDSWLNEQNLKIGNSNGFVILELGKAYGIDTIVSSYEIGNESYIDTLSDEDVFVPSFWELTTSTDLKLSNDTYTNNFHLIPYYPNNNLKFMSYSSIDFDSNELNYYKNAAIADFTTTKVENNDNVIDINSNVNNIASAIPIISSTDLGANSRVDDFVKPSGYDLSIRKEIYNDYCIASDWWVDDDGKIASWFVGDKGDYNGRFKICSSWQIYEWLLEKKHQLESELDFLQSRTQEQIDYGISLDDLIKNAGLDKIFDKAFSKYPGIFTEVNLTYGFYTFSGDDILNQGSSVFMRFGYRQKSDILNTINGLSEHFDVDVDQLLYFFDFEQKIRIYLEGGDDDDTTGFVSIFRLNYDKFMMAPAKYQFFIATSFLGLKIVHDQSCQYDRAIVFLILVIITIVTLGTGTPEALTGFALYLAEFSIYASLLTMWLNFLGLGDNKYVKAVGVLAAVTGPIDYSNWTALVLTASLRGLQVTLAIQSFEHSNVAGKRIKEMEVQEDKLRRAQTQLRSEHKANERFMPLDNLIKGAEIKYDGQKYLTIITNDYKEKYGEQL